MNPIDPNAAVEQAPESLDGELSVEEIAFMDAADIVAEIPDSDETGNSQQEEMTEARATPMPVPVKPTLIMRRVSGRYRSCPKYWILVLRVDVDGYRPMRKISGDFHSQSGATTKYFGSFVVDRPSVKITSSMIYLEGVAKTTWPTSYNKIRVGIARHNILQPPADAHVLWRNAQNRRGSSYVCDYESRYFRSVDLEQDYEKGVKMFRSYNTASLPSGGANRTLTAARAYAEAGIEMRDTSRTNEIGTPPGTKWSNSELHGAMEKHFSRWRDVPQFKVWYMHAYAHDMGRGLYGIMFDLQKLHRQGCAGFYLGVGGDSAVKQRDQLYVAVHELGHCFNLFHSFHKQYMDPPLPNRLGSLSWMNYPSRYKPGGTGAYWNAFPFQFDNLEVIHLRHAFRNNIIMGGNPFGKGAALEGGDDYADLVEDHSGLQLNIRARKSHQLGEPVTVEVNLTSTDSAPKQVHANLDPKFGFVEFAVVRPDGNLMRYEPPIHYCIDDDTVILAPDNPAVNPASAVLGYNGKAGLVFDRAGSYQIRAAYLGTDESVVLSNVIEVRIRSPRTDQEDEVADLMLTDEVGVLLALDGSDSPSLAAGNQALDRILADFGDQPVAVHAALALARNASRPFKSITDDYNVDVRDAQPGEAERLYRKVIDSSKEDAGVDDICLLESMKELASLQEETGSKTEAEATKKEMLEVAGTKDIPSTYMDSLESFAK